jgi:hypothetical protein
MEKIITIQNKWNIESYNISYTLELTLYPSNAIVAEFDTANIKQLTAFQTGFLFSNLEKANVVVKEIIIESNDPIINKNCKLNCYCCFNKNNLTFVEPKIYFENEISKVIVNTDKIYITFFIETILNNLKRSIEPEEPEEPNKKQAISMIKEPNIIEIDPNKYFIRGTIVKDYKWYSEKILKLLFNPTDIEIDYIYEKYEESGYPKKYINKHPMFYKYELHNGNSSKLIRKKDIYIYITVNYFPAGVYNITIQNNISKCDITQWDDVDNIKKIYNSIKTILENQFSNDPIFEGIPALIPYYIYKGTKIEKMISWGFITKIMCMDLNIEDDALAITNEKYSKITEYFVECKYFDNKNRIIVVMLKDCIISKDIPFGMCKDKQNNIVYQYYSKDYLKRQNKILLPNLSID